jgi:molecular chaperone DnaK
MAKEIILGIDLGTTNSVVSYVQDDGKVKVIPNPEGPNTTPSVVSFKPSGEEIVGFAAKRQLLTNPDTVASIKRKMGTAEKVHIGCLNKDFTPQEISAKVLAKLKQSAEVFLGREIRKVVITVPAYFNQNQKEATIEAGKIAGLEVIKIINEPTAAALAYGFGQCKKNSNKIDLLGRSVILDENQQYNNSEIDEENEEDEDNKNKINENETKKVLVFDLGGGTFDVTLLELEEDNISIINHGGNMHLGGEDFDNILRDYCIEKFRKQFGIDLNLKEEEKEEYIKAKIRLKQK